MAERDYTFDKLDEIHTTLKDIAKSLGTTQPIKVNLCQIVSEAVETGCARGWMRAHKHNDSPSKETILEEIEQAVLNNLSEYIDFSADFGK